MSGNDGRRMAGRAERGVALIVGLLLLLVLTLIGVSGLRKTSFQEKAAFNEQAKEVTFQAAETAIQRVIANQATVLNGLLGTGTGTSSTGNYSAFTNATATTATLYENWEPAPGFSIKSEGGGFVQHNFLITATGSLASAVTINQQGIYKIGPSGGS